MNQHLVQVSFDRSASGYAAKYAHPTDFYASEKRRRMQLLVETAESIRPAAALDAGCGPGVVLDELSRRLPDCRLVGMDLSHSMLQQVGATDSGTFRTDLVGKGRQGVQRVQRVPCPRLRGHALHENAGQEATTCPSKRGHGTRCSTDGTRSGIDVCRRHLVQSDVEHPPFADGSFEMVYALGVVDYCEHPERFFRAAWRMLKPGGTLAFTYPNADCLARTFHVSLRKCAGRLLRKGANVSARPLTGSAVESLTAACGFRPVRRRFITYGNVLPWRPWSPAVGRTIDSLMERWCGRSQLGRYLAWSCFCVVHKPNRINGDAHDL